MSRVSVYGLQADAKLYNQVVAAYRAGNNNELIRLILAQYNWAIRLDSRLESTITYNQSRRLAVLYITLAKIANAVSGKGEYNLTDVRENELIGHRGWYIRDYMLPDIIQKALPTVGTVRQLFDKGQKFMSPEYGVVQSIITAGDLRKWLSIYEQQQTAPKGVIEDDYFADAQQVFRNIVSGRSVVLLTRDTLVALKDFTTVFYDEKNPKYKPEYEKTINEAIQIVNQDIAELNKTMQQQLDRQRETYS